MRFLLLGLFISMTTYSSFGQLREGFDQDEMKTLIQVCNSFTFLNLYGDDKKILPKNYNKIFTSETIGMDNKFQVYSNGKIGIINFRGSTSEISSWVENMYSAMIPSQGIIKLDKTKCAYSFAKDKKAGVHAGYALAVVMLSKSFLEQIKKLNAKGIYNIIITGHSQGGALANLSRAYLENLPKGTIAAKNKFKTYAFANPMCGNKEFAEEFDKRYVDENMCYSIINPADLVPYMPMHYEEEGRVFSKERLKNWIFGKESLDIRKLGMEFVIRKFEKNLKAYVKSSNMIIEKTISKTYASVDMPNYLNDINYFQTGNVRELKPFEYPKIKLDTEKMTEKELSKLTPDEDGNYYKKEPSFYQHKPYNYYVGILKEYFSREYKKLEVKQLPENL